MAHYVSKTLDANKTFHVSDLQTNTMDENSFTTSLPSNSKDEYVNHEAKEKKGKFLQMNLIYYSCLTFILL